jgi:TM2 domain-containing membrane protein YozV
MRGTILDFSVQTGVGIISGDDGHRYSFPGAEWKGGPPPQQGARVDFAATGDQATGVYPEVVPAGAPSGGTDNRKSKLAAGLLGIFLGGFGIHRFYLGYTGIAIGQICATLFTCGVVGPIWGLIDGILILTGSVDKDAAGNPLKD